MVDFLRFPSRPVVGRHWRPRERDNRLNPFNSPLTPATETTVSDLSLRRHDRSGGTRPSRFP